MIIGDKDIKLVICDIETYKVLFDVGFYDPDKDKWIEFEISSRKNDLYKLVKFYSDNEYEYFVGFNNISFDQQVIEFVIHEYNNWVNLSNLQIVSKIYDFAQKIIYEQNYRPFMPYKESSFFMKPIDLFKIHHFDNEQRRTSLKWCAYMMDMNVEELPYFHGLEYLTSPQIDEIISYRRNDVIVTLELLKWTIGDCENDNYKGKNKIQDRFDVMEETGMSCLNLSDVTIGEEWNKIDYKNELELADDSTLYTKQIKTFYGKKFRHFFPKHVEFNDPVLIRFIKEIGDKYILNGEQEFKINYKDTTYTISKGGIHSCEKPRFLIREPGFILRDADVGSQYPNGIVKYKVCPPHLDDNVLLRQFEGKIERRFVLKPLAKKGDKKAASIQEMLKLCLNGGYYGKLNQPGSFLTYPYGYMQISIGNQLEILMLIEMMESAGISVISGNTDGILCYFHESKEKDYFRICAEWEQKVGNIKLGKLEFTDFDAIYQENVNFYIAKGTDGKIKKKGRFVTVHELNKNKSFNIIPLAIEAYFIHNIEVEHFIKNHKNIYDFCAAAKANKDFSYQGINPVTGEVVNYKKLIRYYMSTDGEKLYKIKSDERETKGAKKSQVQSGNWLSTVINSTPSNEISNIDYNFYIDKVNDIIYKIKTGKKPVGTRIYNQLTLL